jgi:exonuclease SbcC
MRPVELRMKAFGPFADEQVINFTVFSERSLFLIHGPTGSGKTSILDAICYALYGQTSVSDRSANYVRSHHADVSVQTEVSLTFTIGLTMYRIERVPEQQKPKSRGDGFTKQIASATLFRKTDPSNEQEWEIIADRWNRVTEKVEEIIGFKCDQFRQVVMLPQGEFRKLLNASSQEKQAILAVLFKTDRYKCIEDLLKEKSREIKQNYETINTQISLLFESCSCTSVMELTNTINILTNSEATASERVVFLQKQEDQLLIQHSEKQQIFSLFKEFEAAKKELNELEQQHPNIDQIEIELELARKALLVNTFENNLKKIQDEFDTCVIQMNTYQTDLDKAKSVFSQVQKRQSEIPDLEKQRDQLNLQLDTLSKLIPKITTLSEFRTTLNDAEQKFTICKNDLTIQKQHLESIKTALNRLNESTSILREQSSSLELLKIQQRETLTNRKSIEQIVMLNKEIILVCDELQLKDVRFKTHCSELDQKKKQLDELEQLQYEHRAALLALTLQEHTPCPVCGSTVHPSPAHTGLSLPDEKLITSLKNDIKRDELVKERDRADNEKIQSKLLQLKKEHSILCGQTGLENELHIDLIDKDLLRISSELKNAEVATVKLKKTIEDIERGNKALAESENKVTELSETYSNLLSSLSSAQTQFQNLEKEIPQEYQNLQFISNERLVIESKIAEIARKTSSIRDEMEKSLKDISKFEASLSASKERMNILDGELHKSVSCFQEALTTSGFTSKDHYRLSRRTSDEIAVMCKRIETFNRLFHSAQDRRDRAQKDCEPFELPDVEACQTQLREIKTELSNTISNCSTYRSELSILQKKYADIQNLYQKVSVCEKEYGMATSLSDVCSGNNSMRITFERFVLATLLDEVLSAGTHRLAIMTQNRYSLHRAKTHTDLRTSGGLDLMVFDSYTGISRPTSSLSGGESFLAALSLALGLADVVQSRAGGIVLDTLFVDEGFGSLDTEALDCAFQALTEIGKSGRLIGIISHVAELKERIDARLELIHGKHGSAVRFTS